MEYLTDNEPDSSGPIGECRYHCGNSENVGDHKYMCLHPDHWHDPHRDIEFERDCQSLEAIPDC